MNTPNNNITGMNGYNITVNIKSVVYLLITIMLLILFTPHIADRIKTIASNPPPKAIM